MFHKKGDIVVPKSAASEDDLMNIVLEAGADDLRDDGDNWEVVTDPSAFEAVVEAIKKAGITPASAEVAMIPQTYVKLEGQQATTMIRLVEALEEHSLDQVLAAADEAGLRAAEQLVAAVGHDVDAGAETVEDAGLVLKSVPMPCRRPCVPWISAQSSAPRLSFSGVDAKALRPIPAAGPMKL